MMRKLFLVPLFLFATVSATSSVDFNVNKQYEYYCTTPSDINEHLPRLRQLANECSTVVEIGLRDMVSTWGILKGLSENPTSSKTYLGIDIASPHPSALQLAMKSAQDNGIVFNFWKGNDMLIDIPKTEFLFIDSLHTYCHLTYELEKFSTSVTKYIAMHDTSDPWGNQNDTQYRGNNSEYPNNIDKTKVGLWPAVEDFLQNHPEWVLLERHLNNHGFTILQRVE